MKSKIIARAASRKDVEEEDGDTKYELSLSNFTYNPIHSVCMQNVHFVCAQYKF